MAELLAIVKSAEEAIAAGRAGADAVAIAGWDGRRLPDDGGMAALPAAHVGLIIDADDPDKATGRIDQAIAAGFNAVWLPFDAEWRGQFDRARGAGLGITGVIAPGEALDESLCDEAVQFALTDLLVGETPFATRRLIGDRTIPVLSRFVACCRERRIGITLIGALEMPDIPRLLAIGPDRLAFDLALRDGQGRFDPDRVTQARLVMRQSASDGAAEPPMADVADRVFVRDWTVRMSIGAYARERGEAQRVRFTVEAEVLGTRARTAGMAGVVSYDLITDAIARLTSGHVDLVETLADDIAASVLAHRRVVRVDVTVEKLDVGPGSVGCRITRRR